MVFISDLQQQTLLLVDKLIDEKTINITNPYSYIISFNNVSQFGLKDSPSVKVIVLEVKAKKKNTNLCYQNTNLCYFLSKNAVKMLQKYSKSTDKTKLVTKKTVFGAKEKSLFLGFIFLLIYWLCRIPSTNRL